MEATTPDNQQQKTERPAPQYNDDLYQGEVLQSARQQEPKQTSQQDNPWDSGADQMFSEPEPSTLFPSLHEGIEQSRAPESISPDVDSMVSDTAHESTNSYDESAPAAEESGYFSAENFLNAQGELQNIKQNKLSRRKFLRIRLLKNNFLKDRFLKSMER